MLSTFRLLLQRLVRRKTVTHDQMRVFFKLQTGKHHLFYMSVTIAEHILVSYYWFPFHIYLYIEKHFKDSKALHQMTPQYFNVSRYEHLVSSSTPTQSSGNMLIIIDKKIKPNTYNARSSSLEVF